MHIQLILQVSAACCEHERETEDLPGFRGCCVDAGAGCIACSDTADMLKETLEQQFLLVRNRTSNNGEYAPFAIAVWPPARRAVMVDTLDAWRAA